MASFTIDPNNRLIILDQIAPVSGLVTIDVQTDLYSEMKLYWKTEGIGAVRGLKFPWKAIGGYSYGGGRKQGTDYFLRGDLGWRIRPYEADHELQFIGNLRPFNTSYPTIIPTVGNYTVYAPQERSAVVQVVETSTSYDEFIAILNEVAGLSGKNTKWTNIIADSNHNITSATITQYTDNTLTVADKVWNWTATYNSENELLSYQMVEA